MSSEITESKINFQTVFFASMDRKKRFSGKELKHATWKVIEGHRCKQLLHLGGDITQNLSYNITY
jgi:hypothetical protein